MKQSGRGIRQTAKELNLNESVVRRWKKSEGCLRAIIEDQTKTVVQVRKIGTGRHSLLPELEKRLFKVVSERNNMGIRVKDKHITLLAKHEQEKMIAEVSVSETENASIIADLKKFKVSDGWRSRFKNRFQLVSRRHTTNHSLPQNFKQISVEFIRDVQVLIELHKISPSRIINLDQVPRYFETESSSTITQRGSSEVFIKKASTSHRRFTFTPAITASGKVLALHLLFSGLKKVPLVEEGTIADVNKTGMWNAEILDRLIRDVLLKKVSRTVFKEPVLIILDSYGTHVKYINENQSAFEKDNVFFKLIPKNLTGLLQPLDVAVNRSFQQFYNDKFVEHMDQALREQASALNENATSSQATKGLTKNKNIKMPKYSEVSGWVKDWAKTKSSDFFQKAFMLCGLVSVRDFDISKLHPPLQLCFKEGVTEQDWIESGFTIEADMDIDVDHLRWKFFPGAGSFYRALHALFDPLSNPSLFIRNNAQRLLVTIGTHPILKTVFDEDDKKAIEDGKSTDTGIEIVAAAIHFNAHFRVVDIESTGEVLSEEFYGEDDGTENYILAKLGNMYGINPSIQTEI